MYKRFTEDRRYINPEFIDGVEAFVEYACQQSAYMDKDKIRCPCRNCKNQAYRLPVYVKLYLGNHGFIKNYYQWVCHGEPSTASSSAHSQTNTSSVGDVEGSNSYRNLVIDAIGHDFNPQTDENETEPPEPKTQKLYDLLHKADEPLWSGCSKLSQLSTVARLLNIKSQDRITEKVFDDILKLLKDALPSDNKLVAPRNDSGGDAASFEGNLSIFMSDGQSSGKGISRRLSDEEYAAARIYVLLNCVEIEEYVEKFVEEIKANDPTITDDQVDQRLESEFADWFNHYAHNSGNVDNQIIKDVALGPLRRSVTTYPVYFVNGYKFHTSEHATSTFDLPEENTALQDDEVEAHSIDAADLSTIPLNDSSGIQVDMDDGDDDLQHSEDDND
ncbi:hypothetical protein CTI12_AA587520 [Artemisia annua]|uniref:Transposase-associated domain-containing protein n=1 Tax=Artemisia annua TaxID=35608 RepID=A0A2U1KLX4_ARTAN|nr:hypothetical protein CTI12_AA587520 [Artemisia annua]